LIAFSCSEIEVPAALNRTLKFWDLIAYGLAYIAPITPLSTLGFVWAASKGLIALAYVLGGVCMYFTAKSYAIMTETVPSAGSVYGFARHCLGAYPGFLAGWMILLDYLLIPAFVYVLIAVALGTLLPGVDRSIWIVLMVATTLTINWFGVTVTTRVNVLAVIVQSIVMFAFLALALVALSHGKGTGHLSFAPFWKIHDFDSGALFTATSICIMSFLGFDAISTLSEEVEGHDRRVVGRAIVGVLVISTLFFVLVAWVLGNLLPGIKIRDLSAATYELAGWAVGPWAAVAIAWAYVLVVGLSNAIPMQVGVARVLYAMGRDRQLPRALARLHARYNTPYVSMIVTAFISLTVALAMRNQLDDLATIVNFGALSGFLLLQLSVIAHFGIRLRSHAWFAHWLAPLIGLVVVLAVFSGMSALAMKVGFAWLGVGSIYGLVLRLRHRDTLRI
jgi:amino acid transporter